MRVRHKNLNLLGVCTDFDDEVVFCRFEGPHVEEVLGLAEGANLMGWFRRDALEIGNEVQEDSIDNLSEAS